MRRLKKIALVLGDAMGAQVSFYWRPFLERALNRETFDARMCDVMMSVPTAMVRPKKWLDISID